nr:MAG TPA: hypothetical protein [Caudoviricetes sp.]
MKRSCKRSEIDLNSSNLPKETWVSVPKFKN